MKPKFIPDSKKAFYSDTNFQILGKIIELVTGKSFSTVCNEMIFSKLNMKNTYIYEDIKDEKPIPIFWKEKELKIPKAMKSFGADGAGVSNAKEMNMFIRGFFEGKLFPKEKLKEIQVFYSMGFPFKYGIGIQKFSLPFFLSPFNSYEMIGHSGLNGTFCFYYPKKELYITGTINQTAKPQAAFSLMIKLLNSL